MAVSNSSMPRTARLYAKSKKIELIVESKSRGIGPEDEAKREKLLKKVEQEKKKLQSQKRLNWLGLIIILAIVTIALAIARALAQEAPPSLKSLFWLFEIPPLPEQIGEFTTVLAPLIAISVAIERFLETGFNWYEQSVRTVADILIAPRETLDWIGREYQEAYSATEKAANLAETEASPDSIRVLEIAEDRLAKAEERLRGWVNAPEYLAYKRALSIWIGLMTGVVIAILGDLGMLRYIGVPVPRFVDMIVTGLIIGSGPGPMHDLIGILQSGKSALGNLSELAKGKSMREVTEAIQKAQSTNRPRDEYEV